MFSAKCARPAHASEQAAFHLPVGLETQENEHFLQKAIVRRRTVCGNTQDMRPIYQLRPGWPAPPVSVGLAGASSERPTVFAHADRGLRARTAELGDGSRDHPPLEPPCYHAELHGRFPCECPSQRGRSLRSRGSRGLRAQARPKEASECEIGRGERGAGGAHHQGVPALVRLPPLLV